MKSLKFLCFSSSNAQCAVSEFPKNDSGGGSSREAASYWRQGSLLFSKFEFSIKPDLRGLSFLWGGLMQFFIKCR